MVGSALGMLISSELALRPYTELPLERHLPQVLYEPHPIRRFTIRPDQAGFTYEAPMRVDHLGFRVNGGAARDEGGTRILALGDSYTFGMGVADEDTWPAQLERRLAGRSGERVAVLNAGTISYNAFQEMDLFKEKGLTWRPHLVIHGLYPNDYLSCRPPAKDEPSAVTPDGYLRWDDPVPRDNALVRGIRWGTRNSSLLCRLKNVLSGALKSDDESVDAYLAWHRRFAAGEIVESDLKPLDDFYRELRELSRIHGFALYVVVFSHPDLISDPGAAGHPFIRHVRTLLDALEIPYVDGFSLWPERGFGTSTLIPVDHHLNASGNAIIAAELDRLLPNPLR